MITDPPAPKPFVKGETPPISATDALGTPPTEWVFNEDYERLVVAWQTVMPQLETLRTALDKADSLARSPQTWDAAVGERYVKDLREWRTRLGVYRHSVLTAISDEAADTPRWVKTTAGVPHAF
ncbi:hypothetical protein [Nonomuraea zeae]|uniref:Uncharacterized protein n=1 Tax=Nonomuraea zeae TaxID=1642303 RepID=A0A5S4H0M3_9ACTN|nr:hypothetical protein [Nonomuraea zeae]TMR38727.1 hypothetical protein ETD85_03935 [Nonomuraea zeae]